LLGTHRGHLTYEPKPPLLFSSTHQGSLSHLVLGLVEDVGQMTSSAVLTVMHGSHEDTGTARILGTFATEALNLAIAINLVVLQHSKFGLFALVLDFLRRGVDLFFALLRHPATQA